MDLKPVVEVLIFRASEAYRSDQTVIYPAFDIVGDWKGSLGMYHGYLTQGYSLVVWETLKDHEDLMHSDKNAQLREDMGKCIDGSATMFHAYFQPSTNLGRVLDAPVTSVGQVKLKQESTHSNLDAVMKLLIEAQGIKGFRGAVYGKEVETDEFAFMTAWDSIEDHHAAEKDDTTMIKFLLQLEEIADEWDEADVPLTWYKKKYE